MSIRVARVVLAVAMLGLLAGAAVGVLSMAAVLSATGGWSRGAGGIILLAALVGAVLGGVFGPLIAFVFLRDVPLGRAIVGTGLGSLVGVAAAFLTKGYVIVAPVLGMVAGAVVLRVLASRHPRRQPPGKVGPDKRS